MTWMFGLDIQMINKVVDSRSQLLKSARVLAPESEIDLAGGRLLIHFLDESNHNGLTADITSYYLDNNDTPPWDTWVQTFIPESSSQQTPHTIPSVYTFLVSWVPTDFLEAVNEATEAECIGMLMWADEPRTWNKPLDYANSIPSWLQSKSYLLG